MKRRVSTDAEVASRTVLASQLDWSRPLTPLKERGYVYFVLAKETRRVKIGHAIDPAARTHAIGLGCSEPVGLAAAIPHHTPWALERAIHKHFAAERLHREWFTLTDEMAAWIEGHALTEDDLIAELWPDERPSGWRRPPLAPPSV